MRRKNLLEYAVLGIFFLCMALALSAALEYATHATNHEYLHQGVWLVSVLVFTLALFALMRLHAKVRTKVSGRTRRRVFWCVCALVMGVGLCLRLWVIQNIRIDPMADYHNDYTLASLLAQDELLSPAGDIYREYVALYPHTIGFPMLFLRPVFQAFGASVSAALYLNLVCSMIAVALTGHIGYRCGGRVCGMVALTAASLWPSHILYASMVSLEPSYTMLILLAVELMLSVLGRGDDSAFARKPTRAFLLLPLLGVALGIASAIRPVALLALAAYAAVQLATAGDFPKHASLIGAQHTLRKGWLCVAVVLVMYLLTGKLLSGMVSQLIMEQPASGLTAAGYKLMVGVNCESQGRWNEEDALFLDEQYATLGSANAAHAACMQQALTRIQQEPENVLNLLVYKYRDMWQTDDFGADWSLLGLEQQGRLTPELTSLLESTRIPNRAMWICVLFYALLGAAQAWRQQRRPQPEQMLFVLIFCGTALSHMLLETQVRYHYNVIPILILLASITVSSWQKRIVDEPPVKVEIRTVEAAPDYVDHTRFDMASALREGHIHISVSEASARDALEAASEQGEAAQESAHAQDEASQEMSQEEAPQEAPQEKMPKKARKAKHHDKAGKGKPHGKADKA